MERYYPTSSEGEEESRNDDGKELTLLILVQEAEALKIARNNAVQYKLGTDLAKKWKANSKRWTPPSSETLAKRRFNKPIFQKKES